jgi:hypothetical protein
MSEVLPTTEMGLCPLKLFRESIGLPESRWISDWHFVSVVNS